MWQRLQTLFLAIATGLVVALFFSLKAYEPGPEGTRLAEYTYVRYFPYLVFLIVTAILQVLALFTFNQRVFQLRTATLSAIVLLAFQIWLAVDFATCSDGLVYRVSAVFPVCAAILDFIAVRYIIRDQLLVESITRLRAGKKNRSGKKKKQ
ncbi:MAG: DUF4293 family protein [Candidatus Cryptobacteroides sp.]